MKEGDGMASEQFVHPFVVLEILRYCSLQEVAAIEGISSRAAGLVAEAAVWKERAMQIMPTNDRFYNQRIERMKPQVRLYRVLSHPYHPMTLPIGRT